MNLKIEYIPVKEIEPYKNNAKLLICLTEPYNSV